MKAIRSTIYFSFWLVLIFWWIYLNSPIVSLDPIYLALFCTALIPIAFIFRFYNCKLEASEFYIQHVTPLINSYVSAYHGNRQANRFLSNFQTSTKGEYMDVGGDLAQFGVDAFNLGIDSTTYSGHALFTGVKLLGNLVTYIKNSTMSEQTKAEQQIAIKVYKYISISNSWKSELKIGLLSYTILLSLTLYNQGYLETIIKLVG